MRQKSLLFSSLAKSIVGHPRFLGFDLGNEIDCLLSTNSARRDELDRWATRMITAVNEMAPAGLHVNSAWGAWIDEPSFSRQNLATNGSATVLHCYALFTGALRYYRYNDPGSLHLLEYMVELAIAYHVDARRQVWAQEVGASAEWMPESYIPEYTSALLGNAARCDNIWGFTWWCSHDINHSLRGFASLEYGLGALDQNNRVKPVGKLLAKLVAEMDGATSEPLTRTVALVIPDDRLPGAGASGGWDVGQAFMKLVARGTRPAIVLASRAQDHEYLRTRGIKDLVKLGAV